MGNRDIRNDEQTCERRRFLRACMTLAAATLAGGRVAVADAADQGDAGHAADHEHHHHHDMSVDPAVKRSEAVYQLPALSLVRSDGSSAAFPGEIDDGRAVLLNFIYTSCTTVCPLTSQVFSQVQTLLAQGHHRAHLMSISIDPEYDTPTRLSQYAKNFQASGQWQFYTGTVGASVTMQQAFNVYRGDKMNHFPATFMRASPGKPWLRLDGFATADELIGAFHSMASST